MSDERDWTVEEVDFTTAEEAFPVQAFAGTLGELEGKMLGRGRGRTADGREFAWFQAFDREFYDLHGEARCAEILRASAHPPTEGEEP